MPKILLPEIPVEAPPAAVVAANDLRRTRRRLCEHIVSEFMDMRNRLWSSHDATPEEILTALGEDAAGFFADSGALVEFLLKTGRVEMEPAEYTAPRKVTLNPDGTVSL